MIQSLFLDRLFDWYSDNGRYFPWRSTKNPYFILVTEVLLQHTDAKKVAAVYDIFFKMYPDVLSLARAETGGIDRLIHGLGKHHRAQDLNLMAREIVRFYDGIVPRKKDQLIGLRGVGQYTANAVLCNAYDKDVPMVDSNLTRIWERFFRYDSNRSRPRCDQRLWDSIEKIIPPGRGQEFNFAMIDLGALVCLPKKPKCEICPLRKGCSFSREKMQEG